MKMKLAISGDSSNNYRVVATSGMSMQMMLDSSLKEDADLGGQLFQREYIRKECASAADGVIFGGAASALCPSWMSSLTMPHLVECGGAV